MCTVWLAHPKSSVPPRRSPPTVPKGRHSPVHPELDSSFYQDYDLTSVASCFLCLSCTSDFRRKTNEIIEYEYKDANERNPKYNVKLECPFCRTGYRQRTLKKIIQDNDVARANTHNRIVREMRKKEKVRRGREEVRERGREGGREGELA